MLRARHFRPCEHLTSMAQKMHSDVGLSMVEVLWTMPVLVEVGAGNR